MLLYYTFDIILLKFQFFIKKLRIFNMCNIEFTSNGLKCDYLVWKIIRQQLNMEKRCVLIKLWKIIILNIQKIAFYGAYCICGIGVAILLIDANIQYFSSDIKPVVVYIAMRFGN